MAMVLNEEQVQLQDAAKKFLQADAPISALRKLRDDKVDDGFSRDLWQQMVELGWAGILVKEEFGGLELSPLWMGLIMEEAGRCLTASPLLSTAILGVSLIQSAGTQEQKEALLPAIAAGELLTALALEESHHHRPLNVQAAATKTANGYSLSGRKVMVLDGHVADKLIVVARTSGNAGEEQGLTLFIIDANASGITRVKASMVDDRNAAVIEFDNVEVDASAVLGGVDNGFAILDPVLDTGRACLASEMLGSCMEGFERVVEYLKVREQFGVLIGTFQALKHRASDMFCEIELCKSAVREALNAQDEGRDAKEVARLASMAKCQLNNTALLVSNEGVQMFGGIGMTDEEEIGFFLKRARVTMQTLGDASFHKDRYATIKGY